MSTLHNPPSERFDDFAAVFSYNERRLPRGKPFMEGAEGRVLTYGRLSDVTARLYTWMEERGLKRGDRAAILSRDDLAVTALFMGCLRYGLTAVIVNPDSGVEEQANLLRAAKASAFFMDADFFARHDPPAGAVCLPVSPDAPFGKESFWTRLFGKKKATDTFPALLAAVPPEKNPAPVPPGTVAYILFTSGTTSKPKGVEITHGNLLAQMKTFVRQYGYTPRSVLLDILPLHHTDGLTQGPCAAFTAGATVCRPRKFTIGGLPALMNDIYRLRVSHFIAVPTMLQLIESLAEVETGTFQNEHFRFVISTAGYLDPGLWERFENRFGVMVVNVYGLTETVCEALYCGPSSETRRIGSIGKPVDTECRITGEDGRDVPDGQIGELWLRGPHVMKGYFEMPEETAAVLTPDGWFKTGDLCRRDEGGFYHIAGRKKNVIICGGINIYPEDVANVLRAIPGVADAAVWGEEDTAWGETVAAAVVLKPGAKTDAATLAEEFSLRGTAESTPRRIHIVDDFPRGPAGKVVLRELRERIAARREERAVAAGENLETAVIACAARSFKCPAAGLSLASTAETVKGWNSLAHVEFLLSLEKDFGIRIGPKEILSVRSIGDALKIVRERKKAA